MREIVVRHAGQNVLVVSHKATLRLLLSSLLGFDARGYRDRLDQSPACLNVVDFKDPVRARLMLFNDISHYQDQPRRAQGNLSKWWDAPMAASKNEPGAEGSRRRRAACGLAARASATTSGGFILASSSDRSRPARPGQHGVTNDASRDELVGQLRALGVDPGACCWCTPRSRRWPRSKAGRAG